MKKLALTVFVFAFSGVILSELMAIHWLHVISKPLIMSSLLLYYLTSVDAMNRSAMVVLAIIFSLAGDVLLMDSKYFIAGLVAFLSAHICYIFGYNQHRHEGSENALSGIQRVRMGFPVILAGTGLVVVLYPVLGELRIPVIIYASVLVIMVITALLRYGRTSPASFWMVFAGAVLFMVSDSLLAINKFLMPLSSADFFIMFCYSIAQFLIIKGLIKHQVRTAL